MSGIKGAKPRPKISNIYIEKDDYLEMIINDKHGNERCRSKIDKEDLHKVDSGKWSYSGDYPVRFINGKITLLHHVIVGRLPNLLVDHINGDKLDNRKQNLRHVTIQQNSINRAKMKGVYLSSYYKNKKQKKWVAHIIFNEKFHYLGLFDNEEDALNARKQAEIKFFGEYRRI